MKKIFSLLFAVSFIFFSVSLVAQESNTSDDYKIKPGDRLEICVFEIEELSKTVCVSKIGEIDYPLLGFIQVEGLTKKELGEKITLGINHILIDPKVKVTIKKL